MEGNSLMSIIKEAALQALRNGDSVQFVREQMLEVLNELQAMQVYLKAISDSNYKP